MKNLFVTLIFALTGCSSMTGYSDVVYIRPVYVNKLQPSLDDQEDMVKAIAKAEDILERDIEISHDAPITVEVIRPLDPYSSGRAFNFSRCVKYIRTPPIDFILAHELGHILGLGHSKDNQNLMSISASGRELTEKQHDIMDEGVRKLSTCPR